MGEQKEMKVLIMNTMRDIVRISNELQIQKEDIVSLIKDNNSYVMVYYGYNEN